MKRDSQLTQEEMMKIKREELMWTRRMYQLQTIPAMISLCAILISFFSMLR